MRGAELPLNTLIIIVLCLIVLIAVVVLFFGVWNPGKGATTLQIATQTACLKVNPTTCGRYDGTQPRTPVYDFDANKDGTINVFHPELPWMTSYCIDDNLETLCGFYYGCNLPGKVFSNVCNNGVVVDFFIITEEEQKEWNNCCIKRICGC